MKSILVGDNTVIMELIRFLLRTFGYDRFLKARGSKHVLKPIDIEKFKLISASCMGRHQALRGV
jgi:hypothetical protein